MITTQVGKKGKTLGQTNLSIKYDFASTYFQI